MERDTKRYIALQAKNGPKGALKGSLTGGWGALTKEFPLTEPPQDIHRQMVHPPVPPVVETCGITVSRHAEFIVDNLRHQEGRHMIEPKRTHAPGAYLTYGEYGISNFTSDLTLLCNASV